MSPDLPLYGRITINAARTSLGRADVATMMIRAMEQVRKTRKTDEVMIQIEMSLVKLPDSTTFDRAALIENQLAAATIVDDNAESPFPGITVGRVAECMASPEYEAFAAICEPANRIGLTQDDLDRIAAPYIEKYFDCSHHFPKWID